MEDEAGGVESGGGDESSKEGVGINLDGEGEGRKETESWIGAGWVVLGVGGESMGLEIGSDWTLWWKEDWEGEEWLEYGPRIEGWLVECKYRRLDSQVSEVGGLGMEIKGIVEVKGNLASLNKTCLQVYNLLVSKSRHKYPFDIVE